MDERARVQRVLAAVVGLVGKDVEAVFQTARQVLSEWQDARRRIAHLKALFEEQLNLIKDRGVPKEIMRLLLERESLLIKKARALHLKEGHFPFIPVIPHEYLGVNGLVQLVRSDGKRGRTELCPWEISDRVVVSRVPYYIVNVEDGEMRLDIPPRVAQRAIRKQGRSCLTADEVIAVAIHTGVLARHDVFACGSRYETWQIPTIVREEDGHPALVSRFHGEATINCGAASCSSRV